MNTRQQYKMAALQGILTTAARPCMAVDDQDAKLFSETAGKIADALIEEDKRAETPVEPFPEIRDQ